MLELGNNRITSLQALNLRGLNQLRVLTLEGNELTAVDGALYFFPPPSSLLLTFMFCGPINSCCCVWLAAVMLRVGWSAESAAAGARQEQNQTVRHCTVHGAE